MGEYERQQERLRWLMEECLESDEDIKVVVLDDKQDENEDDQETKKKLDTDTEQEISDDEHESDVIITNVWTRSDNILTHLPGPKAATRNLTNPINIGSYFFLTKC